MQLSIEALNCTIKGNSQQKEKFKYFGRQFDKPEWESKNNSRQQDQGECDLCSQGFTNTQEEPNIQVLNENNIPSLVQM